MSGDGTVGKACDVLDRVADFGRPVRFNEVLAAAPYPKATLYRLLQVLRNQELLTYDPDDQTYAPGLRAVRWAHSAWTQSALAPIARPILDRLSADLGETVHLAQLVQGQVLYVDKRNAARPVEMFSQAGKIGPAYCTGVGKAMLAFLSEPERRAALTLQAYHRFTPETLTSDGALDAELTAIRARGFAFDREEHEPGIICVAAPVLSIEGRVLGALSVTGTTERVDLDGLAAFAPNLQDTATQIAAAVRDWRFPDEITQRTGTG